MSGIRKVLIDAIRLAGEAVRNTLPTDGVVKKVGRANIVTAADIASEKIIIQAIKTNYPGHPVLSEETESDLGDILTLDYLWVIDPIDGTNNFRYQRNYSCVSVGYLERGIIKAGAVYDPFRDELFYAEQGQGALLNGKKIAVSDQNDISKSTLATDNSYDPAGTRRNLELILQINPTPWILMKGSAVLTMCEVASGRIDLYMHTSLKPWDNAAAFLIVKEAGGFLKGLDGEEINFLSPNVLAGNQNLVEQCVKALK